MSEFAITFDMTQLYDSEIVLEGPTRGSITTSSKLPISASSKLPTSLKPGEYRLGGRSQEMGATRFSVTADGKLNYGPEFDGCLQGRGGTELKLVGYPVTLDARYVAMDGGEGVVLGSGPGWIVHRSIHLLPGRYRVEQASAKISTFAFDLLVKNVSTDSLQAHYVHRFDYHPELDVSQGGFLEGLGTDTIVFRGYQFLIDANTAGARVVCEVNGIQSADNGVMFASFLPTSVGFGFSGGDLKESVHQRIVLGANGAVDLTYAPLLEHDTYRNINRLRLVKK